MSNETTDLLNFPDGPKPLPQGINVLTILTFIGCAFSLLITAATPIFMKMGMKMMDQATSSGKDLTDAQMADITKARKLMDLTQQNMVPLIIIGLLGAGACFLGALWMRKLKKDGYWVYVAGEILPIIGSFILLGTAQYTDWKSYLGLIIPIVFVILYTFQKKYLVK